MNKNSDDQDAFHSRKHYDKVTCSAPIPTGHPGVSSREVQEAPFLGPEGTRKGCLQAAAFVLKSPLSSFTWRVTCLQFGPNATRGWSSGFGADPESSPLLRIWTHLARHSTINLRNIVHCRRVEASLIPTVLLAPEDSKKSRASDENTSHLA